MTNEEITQTLLKMGRHQDWLIAQVKALHRVVRSLAEAGKDNPAFLEELSRRHQKHLTGDLNSAGIPDQTIDAYNQALKEHLPAEVAARLFGQ